jgi:hypothetical protein
VLLALLASLVLGVVTIAVSRGTLRRIRQEPGAWLGRRRTIAAAVLGWLGVLAPLGLVALIILRRLLYG